MASTSMEQTFVPDIPFQAEPTTSSNGEEQSSLLKYRTLNEFQIKKKSMIDKINEESRQLLSVLVGKTTEAKQEHIRYVIRALNKKYPNVYIMWANESMFCDPSHPVCNTLKLVYFRKKQTGEIDIEKAIASSRKLLYTEYKPNKTSKTQQEIAEEPPSQDILIINNIKISNTLKSSLKLVSSTGTSLLSPPEKSKSKQSALLPPPPPLSSPTPIFIYDVMEELFAGIFTPEFQAEFEARYRSQVKDNSRIVKAYIPSTMSFEDAISSNPAYSEDFPGKKMEYLSSIVFTHYGKNSIKENYSFNDFKSIMSNASSSGVASSQALVLSNDQYKAITTLFNSSVQPYNSVIGEYSHEYYKTALYESQSPDFKFECLHFLQQNTIKSTSNPYYKSSLSNDLIKILYSENLTTRSYQSILQQFPRAMDYIYELSNTGPENNPFVVKTTGGDTTNVKNVMEFLVDGVLSLFMPHENDAGKVLPPPNAFLGNALKSLNRKDQDTRVGFQVGGGAGSIFFSVAMGLNIPIPEDIIIKKTDFDARVYYIASTHDKIIRDIKNEYTGIIRFLEKNNYFDKTIVLELNSRFRPSRDKNYVIQIKNSDIKWRHHTTESNFPAELLSIDILYNVQIGYINDANKFIELGNYVHTSAIFDIVVKPVAVKPVAVKPVEDAIYIQEKRESMYSPGDLCPIATPVTFIETIVETLSGYASVYNRLKTGKISKDYDRVKVLIQMLETYKITQLKGVESDSVAIVNQINDLVVECKDESKKGLALLPELLQAEGGGIQSTFVRANNSLVYSLNQYLTMYSKEYDNQLCARIQDYKLQIANDYETNEMLSKEAELKKRRGVTTAVFKSQKEDTSKSKSKSKSKKTQKADSPKSNNTTQKRNATKEVAELLKQRKKEKEQQLLTQTIIDLHRKSQKRKRKSKINGDEVLTTSSADARANKKRKTQRRSSSGGSSGGSSIGKRKNKTRKNQYK